MRLPTSLYPELAAWTAEIKCVRLFALFAGGMKRRVFFVRLPGGLFWYGWRYEQVVTERTRV